MVEWFGDVVEGKMQLNQIGKIVAEEWIKTPIIRDYIELYEWVVMPNHFHGIIGINDNVETHSYASLRTNRFGPQKHNLSSMVRGFKGACTKRIRKDHNPKFAWQSRFWDHIIRNEHSFKRITKYIRLNPQNWERDKNNRNVDSDFINHL